jgi:hypothetical protein
VRHFGAFVSSTGSATAMLFNPAGLAKASGRFSFLIESGWHSQTDYLDFFNNSFSSNFLPVQFAAATFRPTQKISTGVFYSQPTNYQLDVQSDETGTAESNLQRAYDVLGLALSFEMGEYFSMGGGVEWRQARLQDQLSFYTADGKAQDWRFSLGAIALLKDWQFGLALRSKYEAQGEQSSSLLAQNMSFVVEEPLALRLGLTSPLIASRLRLSADAEYQNFDSNSPIASWQFYGGGRLQLSPALDLGLGCFTFRQDYAAFIDGPPSEVFLTAGGALKIGGLRLTASYMDGDLLNQDFQGQRFLSLALGFAIP